MSNIIKDIHLTARATKNLKDIYKYSVEIWGHNTASKYIKKLNVSIDKVAKGGSLTKINKDFGLKFSYIKSQKHYIFFHEYEDKIIVVAIFHTSMNIKNNLIKVNYS